MGGYYIYLLENKSDSNMGALDLALLTTYSHLQPVKARNAAGANSPEVICAIDSDVIDTDFHICLLSKRWLWVKVKSVIRLAIWWQRPTLARFLVR